MRLFSREKPKIKITTTKKDGFSGWLKCTHCNELIHANELQRNSNCCPKCDYHYRLSADERLSSLADPETFVEMYTEVKSHDFLEFADTEKYTDRLASAIEKSGHDEAVVVGRCSLANKPIAIAIFDFNFMGGSMGAAVGERITLIIEYALVERLPLIIVSSSGGARMQESILSLMQMAKTSAALARLDQAKIPYISVLTNPTTGGVTASFASLGDVIVAEPNALICFAGPRVIEQTIGQKLPAGAQKSEFLLEHGMIDCITRRHDLKNKLVELLDILSGNETDPLLKK
ncbi:MAG: acetyl-CoA carboxylase carboxyltransferase subunit beta [Parachlamydiaceae bacterium]|nr:acetyl-CoA carboxylase carboxyltransferase subunit beta [Parachlamydiaceae bacterium]